MRLISNAFCAENFLFSLTLVYFVYSLTNVYQPDPSFVIQLRTFEDLKNSIIQCNAKQENDTSTLPRCPIDGDRLEFFNDYKLNRWLNYHHVEIGGRFRPIGCDPIQRVAIVIPYRNRQEQLEKFSLYIHQFLPDQLIDYSIYVIEQSDELPFNRAKLFNVGVVEIGKLDPEICCFIFHDVDLLPLDQRNLYMCSRQPRHMSPGVSTLRFKLLYPTMFGGVIAITKDQFETIGGFSNEFFGWGGEDDDTYKRVRAAGFGIDRTPKQYGLYTMLKHSKMQPNPLRYQLLENSEQNITNIPHDTAAKRAVSYVLDGIHKEQLFTRISVRL